MFLTYTDALKMVNPVMGDLNAQAQGSAAELDALRTITTPGLTYIRPLVSAGETVSNSRTDNQGVPASLAAIGNETITFKTYTKYMSLDSRTAAGLGDKLSELQAEQALWKTVEQRNELGLDILAGIKSKAGVVVNAGGATANGCTSAYLVYTGVQGSQILLSNLMELGDWYKDDIYAGVDGNQNALFYPGFKSFVQIHAGFSAGDTQGIIRIANLDATKTLSDSILADALAALPTVYSADKGNVVVLMSRRGRSMLQHNRTTALNVNVPTPVDFDGYKIIATDSILSTEAVYTPPA